MDFFTLLKKMFQSYFFIYSFSIISTLLFCLVFNPDCMFGLDYFAWMMLFSLMGDLPSLVFYSKRNLTAKDWNIRMVIHFILLQTVLCVTGYFMGTYHTPLEFIFFVFIVTVVYIFVRFLAFSSNKAIAEQINKKLQEIKKER